MKRLAFALACHAAAAVWLLSGCSRADSEEQLVASARGYVEQQDYAAAIVQLKALLQDRPNSGAARLLLGKVLADTGDPVAALVELDKAKELGVADDEVAPETARALLMTGEHAKVIASFGGTLLRDPKAIADLTTSVAIAHALGNDRDRAQALSQKALQAQPGYAPALILQARLLAAAKDLDGALRLLDDVLAREPNNERAGLLKAEVLLAGRGDTDGALATLRKVLAVHPKSVPAHVAVITILGRGGQTDQARLQLAELKKAAPAHPDTLHLDALQRFREGDYKGVVEITERLLKVMPDHPRVLFVAGAAQYRLSAFVQAETHLQRAMTVMPGFVGARQLLAQTHLRRGDPAKALEVLAPLTESDKADGLSLALSAEAHLAAGDARSADEAFARAARAAPADPRVRTSVALGQLARGQTDEAIGELEAIAAADRSSTRADLALITARLRSNDLDGALKAVDGLRQKAAPDSPLSDLLRGRILQGKGDAAGAAAAFEAALKKDPKYFPGVAGLASLDVAAGRTEQAKERLEALLQTDPSNHQAHVALAELAARNGATPQEVARGLAAAVKANPTQAAPRLLLIEQLLRAGDAKAALVAAQDAAAALPGQPAIQEALGRAQIAAGDGQQAVSTFSQLAGQQARNPIVQIRLAEAHVASKNLPSAQRALERALELRPDWPLALRGLASIAVQQGRHLDAIAIARRLQKAHPQDPAGHVLEGDILSAQRSWAGAVAAHRAAFALGHNTEGVVRLHQTCLRADRKAEAEQLAASWRKEQPADMAFRFYLGDVALAQKDWATAESHYRAVAQAQPRNALALNNIAWLMAQQGKPGAVAVAEQANQILPGRAQLLDTLATAQAAENLLPQAIETQQKALASNPQDPGLRLNLARLYLKAGQKPQARAELEDLARLGDRFGAQAEVSELLERAQ